MVDDGDGHRPAEPRGLGELEPLDAETRRYRDRLIEAYQRSATGILHLGAHLGQEREAYARKNLRVVWVEAHPMICRRLQRNLRPFPDQQALCGLLAEVDGREMDFRRSSNMNGESSSIYEFGAKAHALWPDQELEMIERLSLRTVSLDSLLAEHGLAAADYDFWVLDLQGAELLGLQGAQQSMGACRGLLVEVSTVEVYQGGVQWGELRDYLQARGFAPAWAPIRPHDDVLFLPQSSGG